ncbi:PH domain-containing protein [Roseiconus lacunae]|uniref:PH domain-containing protein n=1 Tax=Roseiconus lacunae TaxID=2605694 RepID=A0ABT7PLE8_9BACT|nr:PH domain-containing protein [Roseiconus lacunae]MCD0460929.1 PH domain-containing protein [Roseiconus lacunae]MDM4017316.1 PH domain-containing protein [Roseiconus lacunae]WRQ48772.1 PH domain-containing protein [Stieleria sp. HD01]
MGLLSGIMGSASEANLDKVEKLIDAIIVDGETIEAGYQLIRDMIVLTNKRVIVIDRQGVTGRKTEFLSIPYRSIVRYSIETAGTFDLDADLKLWLSSTAEPLCFDFRKSNHVSDIVKILTRHVCG